MSPKNDFNLVENIRENNIDIFDLDEQKDDDLRSERCHTEYENPLKLDLNHFLERNAINLEDLLFDQMIVVIQEKKQGPRKSIILKDFVRQNFDDFFSKEEQDSSSGSNLNDSHSNTSKDDKSSVEKTKITSPNVVMTDQKETIEEENLFTKLLLQRENTNLKLIDVKQSTDDKSKESFSDLKSISEKQSRRSSSQMKSNKSELNNKSLPYSSNYDARLHVALTNEALNVKTEINDQMERELQSQSFRRSSGQVNNPSTQLTEKEDEEKESLEEKLTKKMTRKLISLILILLVFIPIFDASYIGMFIYDSSEVPTVPNYCLNSLDDAFTKSLTNLDYIGSINKIFSACLDLAEDGSSIKADNAAPVSSSNESHQRLLNSAGAVDEHHVVSPYPPYFYYFNFSSYDNYYSLLDIINAQANASFYLKFLPNVSYQHPDYDYILHYEYSGYSYFRSYFSNEDNSNSTIEFVYNNNSEQYVQSILNIIKVVVVGFMLIGGSYFFTDLINYYVVRPLDKVMTRLEFYLNNTDSLNEEIEKDSIKQMDVKLAYKKALLMIEDKQSENKFLSTNNETYELDNKIKMLINLISISIGKQILNTITSVEYDPSIKLDLKRQGLKCTGAILMLKITNMDKFIKNYGEEAYNIINKIYSVFHSHAVLYLGDIYTGKDVIIWKEERPKMVKEFKKYIAQINNGMSQYLDYEKEGKKEDDNEQREEFEYCRENIVNLAFLCANKTLHSFYKKIPRTMRIIKENEVKINLFLNYGDVFHGYIGNELKIDECYTGSTVLESESILVSLNKVYSDPSCFFHFNFVNLLPLSLFNITFPCEVVKVDSGDMLRLVRIFKLYFNPLKMFIDIEDTQINHPKSNIIKSRKSNLDRIKVFNRRLEDYIISEEDIEFHTLKNLPTNFIQRLKFLFDEFQCNKLADCVVTIRKMKKDKDYSLFSDNEFKKNLDQLSDMITYKLAHRSKSIIKFINYTIKI